MHSLSAKTHGNSNDYQQLKSIATAIRNSKSSPTTYDNRKSAYLLFIFKMADSIDIQIIIDK